MKKTILLSSILAVGAAFADPASVTSANAIGALDVTIPATRAQSLVSVPFLGYENGGAVAVKDMVKTSNLGADSKLYVPDGTGAYNTFKLSGGKWVADQRVTIGPDGQKSLDTSEDQGSATVARGDAFWIEPSDKSTTDKTIYLLGLGETASGSSTVTPNVWNLVGNTTGARVDIADKGYKVVSESEVQGYSEGEKICVQKADGMLETYTYREGWLKGRTKVTQVNIDAGQGFWFLSRGTTTIKWN